jgi:flap endonuclease-1
VVPELLELKTVLKELGLTHEQLIAVALLMGTDYNPGVHGIGPKTGLKIVREQKTLDKIIAKAIEKNPWTGPEPQELVDFYLNPPHEEKMKLEPGPLKARELRAFMLDFEFGAERIDKVIATLSELQPKEGGLGKWTK